MLVAALLLLTLNCVGQKGGVTPFGPELGADYPAFYMAGQILNTSPEQLYDLTTQEEVYHRLIPHAPVGQVLLYPYAPFLAVFFQPLALLPYTGSYLAWLAIGALLTVASLWFIWKATTELAGRDWLTVGLAAVSFTPLLLEGWIGGQTVPLVLFCTALAVYLHRHGYCIAAGTALAILAFKPTLLVLMIPMLVVTRSFRVLAGLVLGGLGLLAVSLWAVGVEGCLQFPRFLVLCADIKRDAPEAFKAWKYVDLRSAMHPLFLQPAWWSSIGLGILLLAGTILLWRTWRHCTDWRLAWASALIWTPILSPHCAIYDTALLIPAVILLAPTLESAKWYLPLVSLVYITAWCSQPIATHAGFQILSMAIAALGVYVCIGKPKTAGHAAESRKPPIEDTTSQETFCNVGQ